MNAALYSGRIVVGESGEQRRDEERAGDESPELCGGQYRAVWRAIQYRTEEIMFTNNSEPWDWVRLLSKGHILTLMGVTWEAP